MLLRGLIATSLLLAPLVSTHVVSAHAENAEEKSEHTPGDLRSSSLAGTGSLGLRIGAYNQSDDGKGNPFLDEELTVIEPVVILDYNVSENLGVWTNFSYDSVSSASIKRLNKFPDQSGASGDYYWGLDTGVRYKLSDTERVGAFVSASTEYDYNSLGFGGDYAFDFNEKNSTVKFAFSTFFDELDIIRYNGREEGTDDRFSLSSTATWYQVIDNLTHGEVGGTFGYQNGFLETPYNAVVIEDSSLPPNPFLDNLAQGSEVTEELESSRLKGALFGSVRRYLTESGQAIGVHGRFYADSWGITSFTLEPRFYQPIVDDELFARFRYRYYTQTEADAYGDHFFTAATYRTQDSDLSDFSSHMFGAKFTWLFSKDLTLDCGVDYMLRSDDLDSIFGSIGFLQRF